MKALGIRSLALAAAVGLSSSAVFAEEAHDSDGVPAAAAHAEAEAKEHSDGEHGDEHHELNLFYGLLGEGEVGQEPNLLFRPPGMPVPILAMLLNTLILFGAFYFLGRKGVAEALTSRRKRILQGMEDAAKMRNDAKQQLAMYRAKLEAIESEVERVKQEMRDAAEAERTHILAEAKARHQRMERDAKVLVEQELKAAHERLLKETVRAAVASAENLLRQQVTNDDQGRLESDYLGTLKNQLGVFTRGAA